MTELALARPTPLIRTWVVGWWALGRGIVFATAAVVDAFGPRGYTGGDEQSHVFGLLGAWDGRWYRTVAENGYLLEPGRQSDPAFFPLFPLLLRLVHGLGIGYVTAGLLIANVSFLVALLLFEAVTRELFDARLARRATMLLAVFPAGFAFSLAYPESVVLAMLMGAVLAALRGRWLVAAALLGAAALARPETMLVALALVPLARRASGGAAWGAVAAPFAAVGSFAGYLWWQLNDPLAWTHAERAWGRKFTPLGLVRAVQDLPRAFESNAWVLRDVAFFLVYLGLLYAAYRIGTPRMWIVSGALIVLLPTFSGSFHSLNRFGLLAPAVFWGLASLPRPRLLVGLSCCLLSAAVVSLPYVFP